MKPQNMPGGHLISANHVVQKLGGNQELTSESVASCFFCEDRISSGSRNLI